MKKTEDTYYYSKKYVLKNTNEDIGPYIGKRIYDEESVKDVSDMI